MERFERIGDAIMNRARRRAGAATRSRRSCGATVQAPAAAQILGQAYITALA